MTRPPSCSWSATAIASRDLLSPPMPTMVTRRRSRSALMTSVSSRSCPSMGVGGRAGGRVIAVPLGRPSVDGMVPSSRCSTSRSRAHAANAELRSPALAEHRTRSRWAGWDRGVHVDSTTCIPDRRLRVRGLCDEPGQGVDQQRFRSTACRGPAARHPHSRPTAALGVGADSAFAHQAGKGGGGPQSSSAGVRDAVLSWNAAAGRAATAACITPLDDPLHDSRMYALTHLAIHDSLNASDRRYATYATCASQPRVHRPASAARSGATSRPSRRRPPRTRTPVS